MNEIPRTLYGSQEVKRLDQLAIEQDGISAYQLMCRAGQAAFNLLEQNWPKATSFAICTGTGNNAGDGFVLARLLKAKGHQATIYQVSKVEESRLSVEAKQARADWDAVKGETLSFHGQALTQDVIVDALLGTGARTPLPAEFQQAILAMNQSGKPILAIDLPSGLNADTGQFEQVVKATATITFIAMKLGLVFPQAMEVVGELYFDNLGVNASRFTEVKPQAYQLIYQELMQKIPRRSLSSHKGSHGHVCIIGGGQTGYSGAVCLAGEAALRAGAGLVSAVVPTESLPLLSRAPAELMCYGFDHDHDIQPLLAKATTIVLGPGLSETKWGKAFFQAGLKSTLPMVVDADGLNWLAQFPQKRDQWILTPHPGEAGRLLGKTTAFVQQDRIGAAFALQKKYGGVIVLKGAGTLIVDAEGEITINVGGFPGLATGGTGDVLAGLIGGLIAQKLSLSDAAKIAVSVHAMAASEEQLLGERGMLASDLFLHIRSLLNPISGSE